MKITILDSTTLGKDLDLSPIIELGETTVYPLTMQNQVVERICDSDILVLNKVKLNSGNLPYAKKLKLICITATGFDNVDTDYCKKNGIAVCNIEGYSTDSVVQLTMAMAFALCTNLFSFNEFVKSGEYTKSGIFNRLEPVFSQMSNMTWGVVGLGNIGTKVAKIARSIGCRVLAYKRTQSHEFECTDIDTLCRESDIISLHVPLNESTKHLIDERRLGLMKSTAVLINVARGDVVDEQAVVRAVEECKIGGLGVDVYSEEPMKKDSPYTKILNYDNTMFTPHMAWGAIDARQKCVYEVSENIKSFLSGGKRSRIV